jgi:osmotically-inducible protein OsmY
MRASIPCSVALVLAVGVLAGACASKGPVEEPEVAAAKELEIHDLLLDKAGADALGVRVTVDRGKAILTGEVKSRATQELAEEVAKSVGGINSVDNRIQLAAGATTGPGTTTDQEFADASLEIKVKRALWLEIGRHASDVEVEVAAGVASLRGTVPDAARKEIALSSAGKVKGVTRVVDLLTVAN